MNTDDIKKHLTRVAMFTNLSDEEISRLASSTRQNRLNKGDILFHKDAPCHGFYMIAEGKIKLSFISPSGNEKIVEILSSGHTFGEAVMFMDKPYPVTAQALADSTLVHVNKDAILDALDSNPTFARKLLTGLSIRLHQLIQQQELQSIGTGRQRIADYLLRLVAPKDSGEAAFSLPASKSTIAAHLGITPEHFSRLLHDMVDSGLITVNAKNIRIPRLEKLRAIVNGDDV